MSNLFNYMYQNNDIMNLLNGRLYGIECDNASHDEYCGYIMWFNGKYNYLDINSDLLGRGKFAVDQMSDGDVCYNYSQNQISKHFRNGINMKSIFLYLNGFTNTINNAPIKKVVRICRHNEDSDIRYLETIINMEDGECQTHKIIKSTGKITYTIYDDKSGLSVVCDAPCYDYRR